METLSYYKPGTWFYTLNDGRIVTVIVDSISISINMNNIQRIVYSCMFNKDGIGDMVIKTHDRLFLTKEDLIKSL